jgi:hypothetical protein
VHELAWNDPVWDSRDVTADGGGVPAVPGSALTVMGIGNNRNPRVYYLAADNHVHELAWNDPVWDSRDVTADADGGGVPAVPGGAVAAMGIGSYRNPRVYYLAAGNHVHELAWLGG